ncbi:branched-chain amino acid ABC transporter permease [uncultured Caballeronia sp.]|uniref:branched-chain amino acid ABC transporter permease n=1 Tax=uncultured Caballeronia sp. TaxID=1827198 RepID=UPI0035CA0A6F
MKRSSWFWAGCVALLACAYLLTRLVTNQYVFFVGEVVLQFIALATAWNIAGGYAGYVNFGTAGFFGIGAYVAVAVSQAWGAPLHLQILAALVAGGVLGLGVGYLSVRLRGIYYSIATIAVAVILEAMVVNWPYVGGAQGLSIVRPAAPAGFANYTAFVFVVMAFLTIVCVAIARGLERSRLGLAFGAIRDNEMVAEACGVPTLRTKCIATAVSGALMAAVGAPYALYASYIDPSAAFSMNYSLLALAMALLGGTLSWPGPVIGALVLSLLEQGLSVTVSPELNLLFIGLILVGGVVFLPGGIYRLLIRRKRPRRDIRGAHRRRTA